MDRPRLKANFTAEVVNAEKVFAIAEDSRYLVSGRGAVAVLPFLDGRHTIAQIAQELSPQQSLGETFVSPAS